MEDFPEGVYEIPERLVPKSRIEFLDGNTVRYTMKVQCEILELIVQGYYFCVLDIFNNTLYEFGHEEKINIKEHSTLT